MYQQVDNVTLEIRNTQYVYLVKAAIPSDQISILSAIHYPHQCYNGIYAHGHYYHLSPWHYLED